jgi:hypothetical protein
MTLSWLSAIAALLTVAASLPCTTNDYVGAYTSCRAPRYVRDAVFRWRSESTCNASEAGSATLPSNRLDLPCNVTCNGGFYLPVGNTACAECSAGTVALGGGVLISHWNSWRTPSDSNGNLTFSTRCEYNDNQAYRPGTVRGCQGWSLAGWNVRSGNISDYETSVLEVRVTLLRAGRVSFDYFVSAEDGYDGLLFLIDNANQIITSADAALPLVSDTPQLTNFNATLTAGTHVLTWRFFKDFLAADGDDMAYIKNLEIYGTAWADDSCAACPTGTYAPGRQLARCLSCPANSKAPNVGSSACIPCDADHEFSRPGATTCLTRALCVAQDYHVTRTLCQLDSEFEGGRSRLQTYQWLEPKLCDSVAAGAVALPSPSNVACQACAGGYRRPENITVCTACPTGQAGGGALNAPCVQCANGEAAVRQLKVAGEVSAWPQNMTTRCAGECAGSGWRLTDTGLDSGVGHGSDAVLTLTWIVDVPSLSPPPYIEFVSTIECGFLFTDDSCTLSFTVTGGNVTHPTITQSFAFRRTSRVYFLATGRRTMTWTFSKSITEVSDDAQRRYRAKLESILLVGANLGGAPTCVKCTGGSVSAAGSVGCSPCDAGTGPNPELTACVPCTQNQFAPDAGRGCRPCPNGTRRLSSTRCDDGGCQFRDNGRLYDLTPLRQNLPVEVKSGADKFQLYVCNSNRTAAAGNTSACVDQNGKPFDTYACQVLRSGVGVSLGDEVGFYTPARVDNMTRTPLGVIVRYAGGEPCVDLGIERSVNITFVCDPLAARGTPMPCAVGGVEPRKCEYCFEWRSLYGCPQCGELDRQQVFSECRLGLRRAFWQWRDDARCWGGALPPPTTVSCAQSSLSCPAGQRLPPGTTECLSCPNGTFSLGTGTEYYSFDQTLDLFRASSLPGVGSWTVRNASMHSSDGTSEMLLSVTYVTPGTVDFGYVMLGNNGTFKFLVDGAVVFTDRARPTPGRVARNITKGDVTFTWRFENGNATLLELSQLQKVIVFDVRTIGTEFASPDCDACPLGTISRANATQCRPCFNNTVAANDDGVPVLRGATQCKACADSEFAYPGTTVCRPREPVCDTLGVHYDAYYTPCVGGQRTMFYSLLRRCVDTTQFDALKNVTEPCVAAPVCPNNQFLFVENGTCGNVPAGHVPVKSRIYLSKLAIAEPYLLDPSAFIFGGAGGGNGGNGAGSTLRVLTGCVAINHARAQCGGGWRARGQYLIDSGDHGDEWTDSLLVIRGANDTFVVGEAAGELQFDATFVDPGRASRPARVDGGADGALRLLRRRSDG